MDTLPRSFARAVRTPRLAVGVLLGATLMAPLGCRAQGPVTPHRRDAAPAPGATDHLRLLLIGDAGEMTPDLARLRPALIREAKDAVVVLGDIVHPRAPACPAGALTPEARALLDSHVAATIGGLGAPTYLVVGNHDVRHGQEESPQEACLVDYAAERDELVFPRAFYTADYGVAKLAFTDTVNPTKAQGQALAAAFAGVTGWRIAFGHHTYKTYRDKEHQDYVRPWLRAAGVRPDMWVNGHAHLLQFGVYDGVPALTSGSAALARQRASCPPACGPGELFGSSVPGYAVLDLTPTRMQVVFKDAQGKELYRWEKRRPAPSASKPSASKPGASKPSASKPSVSPAAQRRAPSRDAQ